jgi:hypothetical protein
MMSADRHPRRAVSVGLAAAALLLFGVSPAAASAATTYFVAPSGSDDPLCSANSAGSPFATVQRALSCAVNGDVVSLAPSGSTPYPGIGSVSQNVTIMAGPGADARSVRVDVSRPTTSTGELVVAASRAVQVQGVTLDCMNHQCLTPNVTNHGRLTLQRDTVTGAGLSVAVNNQPTGSTSAWLTVLNSTIAHNTNAVGAAGAPDGAGISSGGGSVTPHVVVANSTIADNTLKTNAPGSGAGIALTSAASNQLTLLNDTITDNHVAHPGGGNGSGGGVFAPMGSGAAAIVASNTLIAGNTANTAGPDCSGKLADGPGGHNLLGDPAGCSGPTDGTNGDRVGVGNPGLNPIANNGGPTDTFSLQPQSPAIAAADAATCQAAPVSNRDQRGTARLAATRGCDIGAYDTGGTGGIAHATYFVAPGGPAATCAANAAGNPFATVQRALSCAGNGDVVSLAPSGSTPYPGIGSVGHNVTIQAGPGADARSVRVDVSRPRNDAGELVVPVNTAVLVQGVTLDCVNHQCGTPNVTNHGTLKLQRDLVTGAGLTVAVDNQPTGSTSAWLTVLSSTIAHNTNALGSAGATAAAGINSGGGSVTPHVLVANSTIADNTTSTSLGQASGAGITVASGDSSQLILINDTITDNHAGRPGAGGAGIGGGIYDPVPAGGGAAAPIVVSNTLIAGNTANTAGPDCSGKLADGSGGHNLLGNPGGCSGLTDGTNGDRVGVANPGLNPVANNGGPTDTVSLQPQSPAIGGADGTTCMAGPIGNVDQRGGARHVATRHVCDIGAYDTGGGAPALYVASRTSNAITSYPLGATGNAAPVTTLSGSSTGLAGPTGVLIDPSGILFVANAAGNAVTEYAPGAAGNAAPIATLSGAATGLSSPQGIAMDGAGDLFVANQATDSITEFSPGAHGNAAPLTTISGRATGLSQPGGITLDPSGVLIVANQASNSITAYAAGATGNATPQYSFVGPNTQLGSPTGVRIDSAGRLRVSNAAVNTLTSYTLGEFAGNVAPVATISGAATGLSAPGGVDVSGSGLVAVANFGSNSVTSYAPAVTGNAAPVTKIIGSATGLKGPSFLTYVSHG